MNKLYYRRRQVVTTAKQLLGDVAESDSAYCDRYYCMCTVYVRLSHSCTLLKLLDGIRYHFGGTLE